MSKIIKVGIIGGTGYTGAELLRLLVQHPNVEIQIITSRSNAGLEVINVFPNLRGLINLKYTDTDSAIYTDCDVVFCATPNGVAMTHARKLVNLNVKLIDLSADFRLKDTDEWQKWYGMKHCCPELVTEAVYGLPELNREQIKSAEIVANPGCYPTASTLGFMPLIRNGLVDANNLIADVKSGVTGAGRNANVANLYSEVSDSFKAYAVAGHRHHPEITANLNSFSEKNINLTFVPHLVPMLRGIHATLYADLKDTCQSLEYLQKLFESTYANEPFVDVMPTGSHPETRSVKSSNMCRISIHQPKGTGKVVVLSVIDNLIKGAAGQAIQNMNIMFDVAEETGLKYPALQP